MSKTIDLARLHDRQGAIEDAYKCYLISIDKGEAEFSDYICAAVIAFLFQDYGFSKSHSISQEYIERSWDEMFSILDMAENKFGSSAEAKFWREYFRCILVENLSFDEKCMNFLNGGLSLACIGFQILPENPEEINMHKKIAYDLVESGSTTKDRYVISVLK